MIRVGLGYDIHRLKLGRRLILGGVEIPAGFGLEGHSDADVATHAIMDALLGAAGLGDIGTHFPPTDDRFHNISSLQLLALVRDLLSRERWRVVNADVVVIAEEPRLAPYADQMRNRIAGILGIESACVSVKATTKEGLGPEGAQEAISAQAVALLESM